jgi:hypothetical protein
VQALNKYELAAFAFQRGSVRRQFKSDFRLIKSIEKFTRNLRRMCATRALSVAKSKGEHAMWKKKPSWKDIL